PAPSLLALNQNRLRHGDPKWSESALIAADRREAVAQVGGAAPARLEHAGALEVEADVVFVGHADAAVELDALAADRVKHAVGLGLGDRGRAGNTEPAVERLQPALDRRAHHREIAEQ